MDANRKRVGALTNNRSLSVFLTDLVPKVQDYRQLLALNRHPLFYAGLLLRLSLILFAVPHIRESWFIPFITHQPVTFNPWEGYISSGGNPVAFPYGIVMYLAYLPLTFIGGALAHLLSANYMTSIGFGFTSLIFDYFLLLSIGLLAQKYSIRLLLLSYWFSPVVIYAIYYHGQIDILPISLLTFGLYLLQLRRPLVSGVVFGLAISAKYSMFVALPFIIVYLCRNPRFRPDLGVVIGASSLTLALAIIPFLPSEAFVQMVFRTPEVSRIYTVYLSYGPGLSVFLTPTAYIVALYLVWRFKRITLDLFIISVGIGFFSLLLLLPPAPGWFLWIIPFVVFYQLRSQGDYLLPIIPFYSFYITYNMLYAYGANFPGLGIYLPQILADSMRLDIPKIKSLLFTAQQASGLLVTLRMYIFGIKRNSYYFRRRRPILIGIVSDSAIVADALAVPLKNLLGSTSVTHICGENYHKWERNHPMWNKITHLNPHASNLSRLTQDVFTLAEGKPIWSRQYNHHNGIYGRPRKVSSSDIIVASGAHTLYMKRLRQSFDLKIFLDCDPGLSTYLDAGAAPKPIYYGNDVSVYLNKWSEDKTKYIYRQSRHADLIFKLLLANITIDPINQRSSFKPRLKLLVTMANGFFHEELVHSLIALCGMHIDIEQSPHLDSISLCIEGDISGADVSQVASLLIPDIQELLPANPIWETGAPGLMQLITLVHISDLLHCSVGSSHA